MLQTKSIGQAIIDKKHEIAEKVVEKQYSLYPELINKYKGFGHEKFVEDVYYHLSYLVEAINNSSPELFTEYVLWAKYVLEGRNVPKKELVDNLKILNDTIIEIFDKDYSDIIQKYIGSALDKLVISESILPTFIKSDEPYTEITKKYLDFLLKGDKNSASKLILELIENGTSVKDIYIHVFQNSQYEIGRLWQLNQINVAQEHYATAATQLIMSQLYPYIFTEQRKNRTMVATCISEDLHEIGIRMIADFFELEGWNTFYLGANTPIPSIIQTVIDNNAQVLAVSVTISYHVKILEKLIKAVRENEKCKDVKILVGGYPFNISSELWEKIGADGFARNAEEAVRKAEQLVNT